MSIRCPFIRDILLLAVALHAAGGCKGRRVADDLPPLQEPPAATWSEPWLSVGQGYRIRFGISGSELLVRSEDKGQVPAEITIGKSKISGAELAKSGGHFPVAERLGGLRLQKGSTTQSLAMNLPVAVRFLGARAPSTATIPALEVSASSADQLFRDVKTSPLRFEDDVPPTSRPRAAVLYLVEGLSLVRFLGAPTLAHDVDWVAITENKMLRQRQCAGYRSVQTGRASGVTVYFYKSVVSIFDRRTGKKLGEKEFLPRDSCPAASLGAVTSEKPKDKVLEAWVAAALRKGEAAF